MLLQSFCPSDLRPVFMPDNSVSKHKQSTWVYLESTVSVTYAYLTRYCMAALHLNGKSRMELFSPENLIWPSCFLVPIKAPFNPLSRPLLIFFSLLHCRSSSPRCSSVGGFHQGKRLRHRQLVSTTTNTSFNLWFVFGWAATLHCPDCWLVKARHSSPCAVRNSSSFLLVSC